MPLTVSNFLQDIKNLVTGGGRRADGSPLNDAGFLRRAENVSLATLKPNAVIPVASTVVVLSNMTDGSSNNTLVDIGDTSSTNQSSNLEQNFDKIGDEVNLLVAEVAAIKAFLAGTAYETNARVLQVEETIDNIGHVVWTVPRDYDEATDILVFRVLASVLGVSTDGDVTLDAEVYVTVLGTSTSADKNPTAPTALLVVAEQWLEFDLKGYGLKRDNVVTIELLTGGQNDTNSEEVLIHDIELVYRSCLVSYDEGTARGLTDLR